VSSSGPDGHRAWLQVGAGALKHCVASGCIPEAILLLEAVKGPDFLCDQRRVKSRPPQTCQRSSRRLLLFGIQR
jgi:hypothetical protein